MVEGAQERKQGRPSGNREGINLRSGIPLTARDIPHGLNDSRIVRGAHDIATLGIDLDLNRCQTIGQDARQLAQAERSKLTDTLTGHDEIGTVAGQLMHDRIGSLARTFRDLDVETMLTATLGPDAKLNRLGVKERTGADTAMSGEHLACRSILVTATPTEEGHIMQGIQMILRGLGERLIHVARHWHPPCTERRGASRDRNRRGNA